MQKLPLFNKQVSLVGKRLSDIYNFEPVCSASSLLIPCWDECTINVVVLINGEEWIKILEIRVKQKEESRGKQPEGNEKFRKLRFSLTLTMATALQEC